MLKRSICNNHSLSILLLTVFLSGMMLMPLKLAQVQAAEKAKASIDLSTAIIQVAKQNIPTVVHIEVTERQEVVNPLLPFESDPFFRGFSTFQRCPENLSVN